MSDRGRENEESMKYRTPASSSKYYIPHETYLATIYYCRQYPLWVAELEVEPDTSRAITYDKERVQSSNDYDATSEIAMRRVSIARKRDVIDQIAADVAGDLAQWLKLGVCYGLACDDLIARGMPCVSKTYYRMRRRFFYELSREI